MNFLEALKYMRAGKKVRRHGFKGYYFINSETGEFTIHLVKTNKETGATTEKDITYGQLTLFVNNIEGTDWEVVEEPAASANTEEK